MTNQLDLTPHSRGMGAIGLPGDFSSASRFIRAVYTKFNSVCEPDEDCAITQFFHIFNGVSMPAGTVQVNGKYEKTVYSSCCNMDKGIYYYTTYENSRITAVKLHNAQLDSDVLLQYPLLKSQQVYIQNRIK